MIRLFIVVAAVVVALPTMAQKRASKDMTIEVVDSLVAKKYQSYDPRREQINVRFEAETDSTKKVKLLEEWNALDAKCTAEVVKIYEQNVKCDTRIVSRIYALRNVVDKKTLAKIYDKFADSLKQKEPYARSIKQHLDIRQVMVGDTVGDFNAKMLHDQPFRFGELSDLKDVLLVFGSPKSMGSEMNLLLQIMYRKINLSKLEIVNFYMETDRASFEKAVRDANVSWLSITDFKGDHSSIKIAFGIQALPTCVYMGRGGAVEEISVGLTDSMMERIERNSYNK